LAKIQNCISFTSADLQHFRCRTLPNFHNPGAKRARHAAESGISPAKPGSGERSSPPGAAREKFSLLALSRDCEKFRS
jgi:hypothetical protein